MTDAEDARDEGMGRAEGAADPQWMDAAYATVVAAATERAAFTVDVLWNDYGLAPTVENRALGPVLLLAKRDGVIVASGEYQHSKRRVNHTSLRQVWLSKVYRGS